MPPLLGAHSRIVIISLVLFSRSEQFYGLGAGLCGVHGLKVFFVVDFLCTFMPHSDCFIRVFQSCELQLFGFCW